MANTAHRNLTASDIHEPKGTDTATAGQTYIADGVGGGTWTSEGNRRALTLDIEDLDDNVTYYVVCPWAGTIESISSVIHAAIATADATLTGKIATVSITTGVITITQSGSAAGDVDSVTPTAANTVAVNETLEIVVTGSNTGATRCTVTWEIELT